MIHAGIDAGSRAIEDPVVFTGGVALIPGMKEALESSVGRMVRVSPEPQMTGALGAAIPGGRSDRRKGGG